MSDKLEKGPELEADAQKGKFLTFSLGAEIYAVEIDFVTEIIDLQPITAVPDLPEYVRGIINLRGKIIPVIDVRLRFRKPSVEYNDRTCIVVVDNEGITVGLIVDTVAEVVTIADEDIIPPPQLQNGSYNQRFIKAIGKDGGNVKLVLDCDRVLHDVTASQESIA